MTAALHHPGEVLAQKLEALGVSPTELARQLHVPANRISQIIHGKRAITGDSALRLAHWFGNTPEFWMNLQASYDLRIATQGAGRQIKSLPTAAAAKTRSGNAPGSHTGTNYKSGKQE
jgi:addiction module HigA family antidote